MFLLEARLAMTLQRNMSLHSMSILFQSPLESDCPSVYSSNSFIESDHSGSACSISIAHEDPTMKMPRFTLGMVLMTPKTRMFYHQMTSDSSKRETDQFRFNWSKTYKWILTVTGCLMSVTVFIHYSLYSRLIITLSRKGMSLYHFQLALTAVENYTWPNGSTSKMNPFPIFNLQQ